MAKQKTVVLLAILIIFVFFAYSFGVSYSYAAENDETEQSGEENYLGESQEQGGAEKPEESQEQGGAEKPEEKQEQGGAEKPEEKQEQDDAEKPEDKPEDKPEETQEEDQEHGFDEGISHDPIFDNHEYRYGIDVSEWQDAIDWSSVKDSGVEFVFIRVGGRFSGSGGIYEDDKARDYIKGALNAGLKVGVYFFSQAVNDEEAIEEANMALELLEDIGVGPKDIELPIIIDVEFTEAGGYFNGRLYEAYAQGDLDTEKRTAVTLAFLEQVRSYGYDAGIYAGTWTLATWHDMSKIENDYKVWIAAWLSECPYSRKYDFWQYSASGIVSGIDGNCDMDVWYESPDYYSASEGKWQKKDGKWYYYTPDGELKKDWLLLGGRRYFMGQDGAMKRGWQKIDDRWYYFGWPNDPDSGAMRTGWIKVDDRWYYMGLNGVMKHGKIEIDGRTYYLGWADNPDSGAMRRGWVLEDDNWYYYGNPNKEDTGAMQFGWLLDENDVWYYLYPSGIMASEEFVNGWWINKSGSWTYPYRSTWRWDDAGWWYGDDSGWYARNATYVINGEEYSFDAAGWMEE
ncbi:MAG: hypothetical protein J5928_02515 [Firmicutes bacterium]|nr:hypothetical protein [Bacillota bacterium]